MSSLPIIIIQTISIFILPIVLGSAGTTTRRRIDDDNCQPTRCGDHGPEIRFPFRKANSQPQNCSYSPAFDIYCDPKNETILQLPLSVNVSLSIIDYRSQTIAFYDPDRCLEAKLLSLNLSSSPFTFFNDEFHRAEDYIVVFNCSSNYSIARGSPYHVDPVSCLGSKGYQFYFVSQYEDLSSLISCTRIRELTLPWDINQNRESESALLEWSDPACGICESRAQFCSIDNNPTGGDQIHCIKGKSDFYETYSLRAVSSKRPFIAAGGCVGSFLVVAIVARALYYIYTSIKTDKKIEKFLKDYEALKPTRFLYADIRRITNDFNEKLGEGGYGIVYKGKLSKEIYVAVKVLNNSKGNGEEFINEVGTIGSIHHVNIVRLVGFCADGFRRALVYDYLPNDSLDKFIFQSGPRRNSLTWEKMQDVAIGIARGIEYLHQGCNQQILHCDIKPHNILLDHNLNPKICDFGLAKFCSKEESAVSMTDARGTMGYISPEMMSRTFGKVSHKSDVYSFGMMLLEMVGGRKNRYVARDKREVYFPKWIYNQLSRGDHEMWVKIDDDGSEDGVARKLAVVGLWCIQWYPADRPSMKMVIQMLDGDGQNLSFPPNPFPGVNVGSSVAAVNGRCYGTELIAVPESDDNSF